LSLKSFLGYIEIRVFSHATEDSSKVLFCVKNFFPLQFRDDLTFNKAQLTGYYNNPILLYKIRLNEKDLLLSILQFISDNLNSIDKETLTNNIRIHLDKNNLYLRFDKQLAYSSVLKFSTQDPIHLKIHFKKKDFKSIIDLCRTVGLIL
jgi:RNA binding exosome subunit